jgi:hypothetical protein
MQDRKISKSKRDRKSPPDWAGEPPDFTIEQAANFAGIVPSPGTSLDPRDHIWRGYDGKLNHKALLRDNRDPHGAMREIAEKIVEANANGADVFEKRERVEIAFHALLGLKRKKGPRRGDFGVNREEIARKAAAEFFWRSVDERRGERDWRKCIEFALGQARVEVWQSEGDKLENYYKDVMKIITPIEDKLLFEVSAVGLQQWEKRMRRIDRVFRELSVLGVLGNSSRGKIGT